MGESRERALRLSIYLTLAFFVLELAGGILSGSLSLLGDSFHMLRDFFSLLISFAAVKISRRPPSGRKTFGYHRYEILAAFLNGVLLLAVSFWIFFSALGRLKKPSPVKAPLMFAVAMVGLVVNLVVAFLLHGEKEDINIKGAFLHVLSDTLSSLAVVVGSVLIWAGATPKIDPLLAMAISLFVLFSSLALLKETLRILLEFAPPGLEPEKIAAALMELEGVKDVHHIHIWSLCSNITAMEAHILTGCTQASLLEDLKKRIKATLREKFNIVHSTLEFEWEKCREDGEGGQV